jgi:hypothetical protein
MPRADEIARSALNDAAARAQDMTLSDEERAEALREVLNSGSQLVAIEKKRELQRLQAAQRGLGAKMVDLLIPRDSQGRKLSVAEHDRRSAQSIADARERLEVPIDIRRLNPDPRNPGGVAGLLDLAGRVPGLRGLDPLGDIAPQGMTNPRSVTRTTGQSQGQAGFPTERLLKDQ